MSESTAAGAMERRRFLGLAIGTTLLVRVRPVFGRAALEHERSLSFESLHTGERLRATYWVDGQYVPEALGEIDFVLRDHRSGQVKEIHRGLLDLLHDLRRKVDSQSAFQVISGYRSPATNAALHSAGRGVASNSLHIAGKAIDVRLQGRTLDQLRGAAMRLSRGGVGYYPGQFVHVDVGRVRCW